MPIGGHRLEPGDLVDVNTAFAVSQGAPDVLPDVAVNLPTIDQSPSLGEVTDLALDEWPTTRIGDWIGQLTIPDDPDFIAPWNTLDPRYDNYADELVKAGSQEEWDHMLGLYDQKVTNAEVMADASFGDWAAYLGVSMLDPVSVGLTIATAPFAGIGAGVKIGTAAGRLGGLAAAEASVIEGMLQLIDPTREIDESALSILGAGMLGGILGAAGNGVARAFGKEGISNLNSEINLSVKAQVLEERANAAVRGESILLDQPVISDLNLRTDLFERLDVSRRVDSPIIQRFAVSEAEGFAVTGNYDVSMPDGQVVTIRNGVDFDGDDAWYIAGEEWYGPIGYTRKEATDYLKEADNSVRMGADIGDEIILDPTKINLEEGLDFKYVPAKDELPFDYTPSPIRPLNESPGVGAEAYIPSVKDETPFWTPTNVITTIIPTPLTRSLFNGISANLSRGMDLLKSHNYFKPTHLKGQGPLANQTTGTLEMEFEVAQKKAFAVMDDMAAEARKGLKTRGIKMTKDEISVAAGRAARLKKPHKEPEIQSIVDEARRSFDDWGRRAVDQGIATQAQIDAIDNYFPRIYDLMKISRNRGAWRKLIVTHFGRKYPDMEKWELEQIPHQIYNTLNNTQMGNAHPSTFDFAPVARGRQAPKSGHLKERKLDISDVDLAEFLIDDIRYVSKRYVHSMAGDVLMREMFGKDNIAVLDGVSYVKSIWDDVVIDFQREIDRATNMADQAKAAGKDFTAKRLNSRADKISKKLETARKDWLYMNAKMSGHVGNPSNGFSEFSNSAWAKKWLGGIRAYNAAASLGNLLVAAVPDIGADILHHGLRNAITSAPAIILPRRFGNRAKQFIREMAVALDRTLSNRMVRIADIEDTQWSPQVWKDSSYSAVDRVKSGLGGPNVANTTFKALGANVWNSGMKTSSALQAQNRLLADVLKWDKLGKWRKAKWNQMGINDEWASLIATNLKKQKKMKSVGSYYADLEEWDSNAAAKFTSIIHRESEINVITPRAGERPMNLDNELGGFITQFKAFVMSFTMHHLAPAGQRVFAGDLAVYNGLISLWGLGALSHYMRIMIKHDFDLEAVQDEVDDMTVSDWIFYGIDRSALTSFTTDMFTGLDNSFDNQVGPMLGMSERTNYGASGFDLRRHVPGLSFVDKGARAVGALHDVARGEDYTAKDLHNMRTLLPLQNAFYLAWLFNLGEEQIVEAMDLPEGGRKKKTPNYGD